MLEALEENIAEYVRAALEEINLEESSSRRSKPAKKSALDELLDEEVPVDRHTIGERSAARRSASELREALRSGRAKPNDEDTVREVSAARQKLSEAKMKAEQIFGKDNPLVGLVDERIVEEEQSDGLRPNDPLSALAGALNEQWGRQIAHDVNKAPPRPIMQGGQDMSFLRQMASQARRQADMELQREMSRVDSTRSSAPRDQSIQEFGSVLAEMAQSVEPMEPVKDEEWGEDAVIDMRQLERRSMMAERAARGSVFDSHDDG